MKSSVSVLMSIYAKEDPLCFDESMNSIWTDQSVKPDEIVLVEDGPLNFDIYNLIESWKEKIGYKLKVVKLQKNGGLTRALNVGIKECTSTYIARMDTDDRSHPKRFEKQKIFMDSNPDIMVSGGSIQEVNLKGDLLNVRRYPLTDSDARMYIAKASPLAHPTVIIRRELFDSGLSYCEKYKTSQDLALWFDVLRYNYKIANLPDILLYFSRTDSTYKRRNRKKAFNEFKIYFHGVLNLYGLSPKLIYPISRLFFRLLPTSIIKIVYNSKIRNNILQKNIENENIINRSRWIHWFIFSQKSNRA